MTDNDFDLLCKAFAQALRDLRQRRGAGRSRESLKTSQEKLALEIGMDRSYVSALERGEHNPTLWTVWRLRSVLRISATRLIREVERNFDRAKREQKKR